MTITPQTQKPTASGTQLPSTGTSSKLNLKTTDFINMMITQLQNQDPTQPVQNDQLLSQMSQIGQLESSTELQSSLKGLVLQNQITSASSLIGKSVNGMDANNATITGTVTSVSVRTDGVSLNLDSGSQLDLARVTSIASPSGTSTGTSSGASGSSTPH